MWVVLPNATHRLLERSGRVTGADIAAVELLHQFGGAPVVHVPEGEQQRAGARTEKPALQAKQFIAFRNEVHSRSAAAQGDQLSA